MAWYISKQSGLWSSATTWLTAISSLSPTASASQPPQSGGGDKIIIAPNHVVEYDTIGLFGDGSSAYSFAGTISPNAIMLSGGELKCSRSVNTELSAYGTLVVLASGFLNWGTESDPITTVNSTVTLNSYPTVTIGGQPIIGRSGVYLFNVNSTTSPVNNKISVFGKEKTVNTYLTLSALSGSTLITVNSASNWQIGDKLVIETEAISAISTRTLSSTFITGITGNNIQISPSLNENKSASKRVSNFSSNITFTSKYKDYPSFGFFIPLNPKSELRFQNCSFDEIGASNWIVLSGTATAVGSIGAMQLQLANYNNDAIYIKNVAVYNGIGNSSPATNLFTINGAYPEPTEINNCAFYGLNHVAFSLNTLLNANIKDCVVFRSSTSIILGTGFPNIINVDNSTLLSVAGGLGSTTNGILCNINNSTIKTAGYLAAVDGIQNLTFNNCTLQYGYLAGTPTVAGLSRLNRNAAGSLTFKDCNIIQPSGSVGRDPTVTGGLTLKSNYDNETRIISLTSNPFDNRRFNYYYYSQSDLTKRKNGINSWRFKPENASTLLKSIDTIQGIAGVTQKIKGNIQFDTNYGITTPPSISFVGSGINQTFTCGPTANIWQSFEFDFTPTSTGDITVTLTGQSPLSTGYIWLDGLIFDPFIKEVRWYGYEFDKNFDRTVNPLNTLTENQVSTLSNIQNLDYLYDAATYWSVTNPSLTSYVDLVTVNGSLLDFGSRNIVINNTGTAFAYNSATNTITLDAPTLSAGTNFNSIKTTGTVTLSTGVISNLDINANIVQNTPTNLTGIYMLSATNTLTYNTNTPVEVEYTNCTMVGVKNDGTAIVTIKRTNSTVTESDAEILTYAPTLINLTLQGGYIALYDNNGSRQYYQNTNGTIVLPANATGTWTYKIARYGYQFIAGSFSVNPLIGGTIDITPSYIPDTFIDISNIATVSAYTDLNTVAKIHDYLSYYLTTSTGIDYGILDSESFGVLNFYGNLIMSASATSIVDYNSSTNTLKLKSSSLNDSYTLLVLSAFTTDGGHVLGDGVKIRATNLDSELYFNNVDSIVFYPTQLDRDNNTNPALSSSGTIYRFKYGSTINGATFSDYIYCRVTVGGITLLNVTPIAAGSTTIDFGTTGNIQTILNNQKIINTGVQKASKLIPHTSNI
jgi:hypothetical protein